MLELAEYFGREGGPGRIVIHQKIGQNDLAAMAGIARENVDPGPQRLAAPQSSESPVRLLLH